MIVTVTSHKGGVGKSTTSVHLAAYLQQKAPTVLVDSDPNRSVCAWSAKGALPFEVIPLTHVARRIGEFTHTVIDTNAGLRADELAELVAGCDLLIVPTTPDALSYQSCLMTLEVLSKIPKANYKTLLTIIPPRPSRDADDLRLQLESSSVPLFAGGIRRFVAFQKAALAGVPVYQADDPRAQEAWDDYVQIGKEILP